MYKSTNTILFLILLALTLVTCSPDSSLGLPNLDSPIKAVQRFSRNVRSRRITRDWLSHTRRDTASPARDVFLQLTTKLKRVDAQGQEWSTEAYDQRDVKGSIYHAALEVQGDGKTSGNIRMEIEMFGSVTPTGEETSVARVRDWGVQNSVDAPVNRFASNDKYIRVIKVGTTTVTNEELMSENGKGIVQKVWAKNNVYSTTTNNCIRFTKNIMDELGIKPPSLVAEIFKETDLGGLMASRHGVFQFTDTPVRLEKYPAPGAPKTDRQSWTFDVADESDPKLLVHRQGDKVLGGSLQSKGSSVCIDINGGYLEPKSAAETFKFFGDNPPTEHYLDRSFVVRNPNQMSGINPADIWGDSPFSSPWSVTDEAPEGDLSRSASTSSSGDVLKSPWDLGSAGGGADPDIVRTPSMRVVSVPIGKTEIAVVRSAGILRSVISVSAKSIDAIGVAALPVAAAFIIVDIVNGDYKAAAFGAAGLVAGVMGLLLAGPIMTVVGLVAGLLLSILPGLINSYKDVPTTENEAQILQYSFFGDKAHTGNEACNAERKRQNLEQNCTAVYGSGVLSKITKWNHFDSVLFLQEYNQGHAMSIIDMAAHLPVKDYTVDKWADDKKTYIDCGSAPPPQAGFPRLPASGAPATVVNQNADKSPKGGKYPCKSPKYIINRSLFSLPKFNTTADKLYNRILPAPGGDCKIIADPVEGIEVPLFDIVQTGRASGFACNLTDKDIVGVDTSSIDFDKVTTSSQNKTTYSTGTVLAYSVATNSSSNVTFTLEQKENTTSVSTDTSDAINRPGGVTSSDNNPSRAYIAPPPPVSFQVYDASNSICMKSPSTTLCLPNGTYGPLSGDWGFKPKEATGITFPGAGSHLDFELDKQDLIGSPHVSYSENIPPGPDRKFKGDMTLLQNQKLSFNMITANPPPPGVCLHTKNNFEGDVACFGVGGANLTSPAAGKANSIRMIGKATAWIYGAKYGDLGGVQITTSVADLSSVPYGSEKSFAGTVQALWIQAPSV